MHVRILKEHADKRFQLAYIGMNLKGNVGGASIRKGFQYGSLSSNSDRIYDVKYLDE